MGMISELVDKLKKYAESYDLPPFGMETEGTSTLLLEAAGTIESLSERLTEANKETASFKPIDGKFYFGQQLYVKERK